MGGMHEDGSVYQPADWAYRIGKLGLSYIHSLARKNAHRITNYTPGPSSVESRQSAS